MVAVSSSDDESQSTPEVVLVSDSPVKSPQKQLPQSELDKTRYV